MPRAALILLAIAVFAGSTWYGYRLAGESFAWLDRPAPAPAAQTAPKPAAPPPSVTSIKTPQDAMAYLKNLTAAQIACLTKAVGAARVAAAVAGQITQLTAQDMAAISLCLK